MKTLQTIVSLSTKAVINPFQCCMSQLFSHHSVLSRFEFRRRIFPMSMLVNQNNNDSSSGSDFWLCNCSHKFVAIFLWATSIKSRQIWCDIKYGENFRLGYNKFLSQMIGCLVDRSLDDMKICIHTHIHDMRSSVYWDPKFIQTICLDKSCANTSTSQYNIVICIVHMCESLQYQMLHKCSVQFYGCVCVCVCMSYGM